MPFTLGARSAGLQGNALTDIGESLTGLAGGMADARRQQAAQAMSAALLKIKQQNADDEEAYRDAQINDLQAQATERTNAATKNQQKTEDTKARKTAIANEFGIPEAELPNDPDELDRVYGDLTTNRYHDKEVDRQNNSNLISGVSDALRDLHGRSHDLLTQINQYSMMPNVPLYDKDGNFNPEARDLMHARDAVHSQYQDLQDQIQTHQQMLDQLMKRGGLNPPTRGGAAQPAAKAPAGGSPKVDLTAEAAKLHTEHPDWGQDQIAQELRKRFPGQ